MVDGPYEHNTSAFEIEMGHASVSDYLNEATVIYSNITSADPTVMEHLASTSAICHLGTSHLGRCSCAKLTLVDFPSRLDREWASENHCDVICVADIFVVGNHSRPFFSIDRITTAFLFKKIIV